MTTSRLPTDVPRCHANTRRPYRKFIAQSKKRSIARPTTRKGVTSQPHWWVSLWTQLTTVATTSVNQNRDGFAASNVLASMITAVIVAMMMMMVAVTMLTTTMWTMAATMATATLAAMVLTMGSDGDDNIVPRRAS